jgi:hypothetical protein
VELPKQPGKEDSNSQSVATCAQIVAILASLMYLVDAMQGVPCEDTTSSGGMDGGLEDSSTHIYLVLVVLFSFFLPNPLTVPTIML